MDWVYISRRQTCIYGVSSIGRWHKAFWGRGMYRQDPARSTTSGDMGWQCPARLSESIEDGGQQHEVCIQVSRKASLIVMDSTQPDSHW